MSAIPQKWASVPAEMIPLRPNLLTWTKAEREAVYAYVGRQSTEEIQLWIEFRTTLYRQQFPLQKELRLWHEAVADLVGWQLSLEPAKVLTWLEEWEKTSQEVAK